MKKLLILFLFLVLLIPVNAQVLRTNPLYTKTASIYCDEFQTVYDAWLSKPDAAEAEYMNAMVSNLVDGGYWAMMDVLYVFAVHDSTAACINWINPGTFTLSNPGSTNQIFTQWEGFTGDGDDYYMTGFIPSSSGTNYTKLSATLAVYQRQADAAANVYPIGVYSPSPDRYAYIVPYFTDNKMYERINTATSLSYASGSSQGFFMGTRRADDDIEIYKNGSSLAAGTTATTGLPNDEFSILARNYDGTLQYFTLNQISVIIIMGGVTGGDASGINTIIEAYMNALSKGVQ